MSEAIAPGEPRFFRRYAPEIALALMALVTFGARLGAMDLWGKREQRAVAEALNTVDENNWLVATIQSRPRLEKPPLPRWTTALLMTATGLRDEWVVRLPSALSAIAMIGLVYGLGRRMAGRQAGLAAGLILLSTFFFVIESRQAGNDGPLAFFTTLAVYAAFRRLHGGPADEPPGLPGDRLGVQRVGRKSYAGPRCSRPRLPEQGAGRRPPARARRGALSADRAAAEGRGSSAPERAGDRRVPAAGAELAGPGGAERPERGQDLVAGDGPEGGHRRHHASPQEVVPRRVALADRPVDPSGDLGRGGRAGRRLEAKDPAAHAPRLVVGGGQLRHVLPLERREAELLRPLRAGRGAAVRAGLGRHPGQRPQGGRHLAPGSGAAIRADPLADDDPARGGGGQVDAGDRGDAIGSVHGQAAQPRNSPD